MRLSRTPPCVLPLPLLPMVTCGGGIDKKARTPLSLTLLVLFCYSSSLSLSCCFLRCLVCCVHRVCVAAAAIPIFFLYYNLLYSCSSVGNISLRPPPPLRCVHVNGRRRSTRFYIDDDASEMRLFDGKDGTCHFLFLFGSPERGLSSLFTCVQLGEKDRPL